MGVAISLTRAEVPKIKQATDIVFWHDALMRLIREAVASKPLHEKVRKMNRWLAANEWHELAVEREQQRDKARDELRLVEDRLFNQAAHVSRLQEGLGALEVQGIEALFRCELTPHVAQVWAITAREIGSTDLFDVTAAARERMLDWLDMGVQSCS